MTFHKIWSNTAYVVTGKRSADRSLATSLAPELAQKDASAMFKGLNRLLSNQEHLEPRIAIENALFGGAANKWRDGSYWELSEVIDFRAEPLGLRLNASFTHSGYSSSYSDDEEQPPRATREVSLLIKGAELSALADALATQKGPDEPVRI